MNKSKTGTVLAAGLLGLTLLALGFLVWSVLGSGWLTGVLPERFPHWVSLGALGLLALLAAAGLLWGRRRLAGLTLSPAARRWMPWVLFLGAFLLSLGLILLTELTPRGDYETYYGIAAALSRGETCIPAYVAMFPHTVAFPAVLAPLFALLGPSVALGQVVGAAFSAGSVALVWVLLTKLEAGDAGALLGAGLWLCMPSRVFYSALLCTENLFHLLALALTLLFFTLCRRERLAPAAGGFALLGGGLAALSAVRPNGLILLIALVILVVCFGDRRARRWEKPALLAVMLGVFLVVNTGIHALIGTCYIRGEIARTSYGWNLAVGMNEESAGRWNSKDSAEFGQLLPELGAEETQRYYLAKGLDRLETLAEEGRLPGFLTRKMAGMFFADHEAYDYFVAAQTGEGRLVLDPGSKVIHLLFDGVYLTAALLAAWSVLRALRSKKAGLLLLLGGLLIIGTFCLHLPMEAALRYKHHAVLWLCIMAGGAGGK